MMKFLKNLFYSLKKSKKLATLQRNIVVDINFSDDLVAQLRDSKADEALEEYLDLCVADKNIQLALSKYELSRCDLKKIYRDLLANGGGQWVKGHYVALSSIAYLEPLVYYIEAQKMGINGLELVNKLLDYWCNKIKQGELIKALDRCAPGGRSR